VEVPDFLTATDEECGINPAAPEEEKRAVRAVLHEYRDVFGQVPLEGANVPPIALETAPGNPQMVGSPRALAHGKMAALWALLCAMAAAGFLVYRPDLREGYPVVMAPKPDGQYRVTGDFAGLTALMAGGLTAYALPVIPEQLARFSGMVYLGKLDLQNGYHQFRIRKEDWDKVPLMTPFGVYCYCRLSMGIGAAPQIFQRVMDGLFLHLISNVLYVVAVYIDDVLFGARTFEAYVEALRGILLVARTANMRYALKKCKFLFKELVMLGHVVSGAGVRPDPDRLQGIRDLGRPMTKAALISVLALFSYFRDYVGGAVYAGAVAGLQTFATKARAGDLKWTPDLVGQFERMRALVVGAVPLHFPNWDYPLELCTDACNLGVGAALWTRLHSGLRVPVAFASKMFTGAELKWATVDQEAYAIYWAVHKWQDYLYHAKFILYCDHLNLMFMSNAASPRVQRAFLYLSSFKFDIRHVAGVANVVPDVLSRVFVLMGGVVAAAVLACFRRRADAATVLPVSPADVDPTLEHTHDFVADAAAAQAQMTTEELANVTANPYYSLKEREGEDGKKVKLWVHSGGRDVRERVLLPATVLGRAMRALMLYLAHDVPDAGHKGQQATYERVSAFHVYWDTQREDAAEWVRACVPCQTHASAKLGHKFGLMGSHWDGDRPGQVLYMDFIGPLEPSHREKYRYALIMVDGYSRYVATWGCERADAVSAITGLMHGWIQYFGVPQLIRHDNARHFENKAMDALLQRLRVADCPVVAYAPWANGMAERPIGTIKASLARTLAGQLAGWYDVLPASALAYGSIKHGSLGVSPMRVHLGWAAATAGTRATEALSGVARPGEVTEQQEWVLQQAAAIDVMYAEVAEAQARAQAISRTRYNVGKAEVDFVPGDLVIVEGQPTQGMEANYSGPAVVVKQDKATSTVTVQWPANTDGTPERVHVQRVKRFNHLRTGTGERALRWCHTPTHLYVVERVVSHRREKGVVWLNVKWRHWDDTYNSDLLASEYVEKNEMVQEYIKAHKLNVPVPKKRK
jgi:transposase InsO family protein